MSLKKLQRTALKAFVDGGDVVRTRQLNASLLILLVDISLRHQRMLISKQLNRSFVSVSRLKGHNYQTVSIWLQVGWDLARKVHS